MTEYTNNTTNLTRDQAIEFIMNHYGEAVKRIIYSYVKNFHTTDDLFQEVLILVYRKWEKYDSKYQLKTWVVRIAINRCKDYLRSPLHRIKLVKEQWLDQKDHQDAEKAVIQQEQWDELAEAILNLPIKNREVMILTFQQNMSLKEIAEVTGTPVSTIKTRMQRAKSLLKKHVSEEEWTLG
ncbi:sigma-70 family RNA polymerase sigma factor [Virgibacillus litoralis]|uniref:RNA polymerase sigma-70 factor (ECF subfamily) n=1 Tax=Virgibacillus litoralis TaxID=578221 RepID=A0ABS4HKI5_9BACI|nr:RNA polymerase sigma-70 factor (ECF subfamily) [Virgibacillus litoralis]